MLPDVRGLRRRMRERDCFVERDARLIRAPELVQPRTLRPEEVKVTLQLLAKRLDHFQRSSRTAQLRNCDSPIERDNG